MQNDSVTSVREVFENMSTAQLDEILNRELHADPPDLNAIRLILDVLREREKGIPIKMTPQKQAALEKYRQDVAKITKKAQCARRMRSLFIRILSSAAVLVVAVMLLVPQEASAKGLWDWFARMTADVVEFFTPADTESRIMGYEFRTDNPGLQRVYDAAVEMGIDIPVVPMWLPDKTELLQCKLMEVPAKRKLLATFAYNDDEIVYNIEIYDNNVAHSFEKDESEIQIKEIEGTQFTIMRNNDVWVAVWGTDTIKCSIFIDCQEDDLYRILKSIYVMEE